MSRLGWLLSHPEFRKNPITVSSGVVSWEIHKLLSRNMSLVLSSHHETLGRSRPREQ
jgi:hypothetical protein